MRNALKAVLFVSAFSPALISVGAARILSGGAFWDGIYYVVTGFIGSLSVMYILKSAAFCSRSQSEYPHFFDVLPINDEFRERIAF